MGASYLIAAALEAAGITANRWLVRPAPAKPRAKASRSRAAGAARKRTRR
jgi:hypothetical protein